MANSNGVISAPVSIYDVQRVLGDSSTDLGTLCRSSKINKWAKYKPVSIDSPSVQILTDRINIQNPFSNEMESVPAWYGDIQKEYRKVSGCEVKLTKLCGLSIPEVFINNDIAACALIDGIKSNGLNWPSAELKGYARLTDFREYEHNANSPFYLYSNKDTYYSNEKPSFTYGSESKSSTSIGIYDLIEYLHGYRFALLIQKGNQTPIRIIGERIEDIGNGTIIWNTYPSDGKYKAYFVLINEEKESIILIPSDIRCENPVTFDVRSSIINPSNNPFDELGFNLYNGTRFGYSVSNSYLEDYSNVLENEYVSLCTTNSYYLEFELTNTSSYAISIDLSSIYIEWSAHKIGNKDSRLGISFYLDKSPADGTISIPTNSTHRLGIYIRDIYYDTISGELKSMKEGDGIGNVDPAHLYYGNGIVTDFYMDVIYDTVHNGYFYSSSRGYYKTK